MARSTIVGTVLFAALSACGGSGGGGGGGGGGFPGFAPGQVALANPGGAQDFRYGSSVAWLDWNADGRPDLAVGAPAQSGGGLPRVGAVFLYTQNADHSFTLTRTFAPANWAGVSSTSGSLFGETLAAGDFDGDGFDDLAIGAPGDVAGVLSDAGRVYMAFNEATHAGVLVGPVADPTGAAAGAEFGSTLVAGSLDADSRTDLAVAATDATVSAQVGAGKVAVLYGTATPGSFGTVASPAIVSITPAADAFFGAAIAIGDLSGDGTADLAIGEPGAAVGSGGAVQIFTGTPGSPGVFSHAKDLSTSAAGLLVEFGSAVAIGDFDGDGDADLVVGAPFGDVATTTEAGYLILFTNVTPSLLTLAPGAPVPDRTQESGAQFGDVLQAGDVDGDGRADLFAAAPAATVGSAFAAGSVTFFRGTGNGAFTQPSASDVLRSTLPTDDAAFGSSLSTADLDGDGHLDLAVGAPGPIDVLTPQAGTVEIVRSN